MTLIATGAKISSQDLIHAAKIAGKIPELIQEILRRQIIDRHIQELGIELTETEVQIAADRFRLLNKLESVETTNQWLAANLLSLDDFEYIITYNLITNKLAQHLFADRVEKFFHQNLLDYSGAIVYEVILADRNLAIELFYLIEEGDLRFADVAHQYIADPELRRRGGYLGKVGRKQLHPEISAAVFAAKPSQVIKPIVTDMGVHLIQVEEIFYPQKLDDELYQQILTELFGQWLSERIIEILPEISIEL